MICLDTNYLILGLVPGSKESVELTRWAQRGEILVTSIVCWYEFLCGPVTPPQIQTMRACLKDILPFGESQALAAAHLFNATGRIRALRVGSMIAGTVLAAQARLATNNRADFESFTQLGLILI